MGIETMNGAAIECGAGRFPLVFTGQPLISEDEASLIREQVRRATLFSAATETAEALAAAAAAAADCLPLATITELAGYSGVTKGKERADLREDDNVAEKEPQINGQSKRKEWWWGRSGGGQDMKELLSRPMRK
ncbi:hypothetical protein LSTR_LSTR004008 [Laodelphax striatellus]|uniref:Uncharacterized protein n=1 Tax=Laodelphax striatellus TaxID=195883 RepID=A0A482WF28_LAOST|nr:hypothetical protein LSTR_LSTR004008 [Laodelphax striatellus]